MIETYKSLNELDEIKWKWVNAPKVGVITRLNGVKIRRDTFKSRIRNGSGNDQGSERRPI